MYMLIYQEMKTFINDKKNFFELSSAIPGRRLVYYLDYKANGRSRAKVLLEQHHVRKWNKNWKALVFGNTFALIGAYIKDSDMEAFEECMKILEDTAPFFCNGYKEARINILDSIVAVEEDVAEVEGTS